VRCGGEAGTPSVTRIIHRSRKTGVMTRRGRSWRAIAVMMCALCACATLPSAHGLQNPFMRPKTNGKISDTVVHTHADPSEHVVELTLKNFDAQLKKQKYVFVMFYAPWDGHSKAFMPRWQAYATTHKMAGTDIQFASVDGTQEKALDKRFEIEEYPTLILFRDGVPKTYVGDREHGHLDKFVRRNLLKPARWLEGTDDVEVFLIGRAVTTIGFFDNNEDLDTFHHAAAEFDLDFGETKSLIATRDWDAPFPTIKMWRNFAEPVTYPGDVKDLASIKSWIATEMVPPVVKFSNKEQLERVFTGPIGTNIFVFLPDAEEEINELETELQKAAAALRGRVHIVTVQYHEKQMHDFFNLREEDAPAIRLLSHEMKYAYKGAFIGDAVSQDIVRFVDDFEANKLVPIMKSQDPLAKDGDVVQVVGKTFNTHVIDNDKHVFIWYYAPWCKTCKALKPVWDKLATMYKDEPSIVIAKMDATKNEARGVHVKKYPTIYYYKAGDKPRHEEYEGLMEADSFADFLKERSGKSAYRNRRRTPHMEL